MPIPTLSPRAKSIALFVSIAFNVLLVSAVMTEALIHSSFRHRDRSAAARVERLAKTLPDPDAEKLRNAFAVHGGALPAARQEMIAARDAFRQALRAEPFDAAAVEKSLAAMDDARARMKQIMRAAVVAAAAEMSAEGRARLADRGRHQ